MKNTLIAVFGAAAISATSACSNPQVDRPGTIEAMMETLDRTDADAVAFAFSKVYTKRSLDEIASFMPPRFERDFEDLSTNRENSGIYNLLYNEPDRGWQRLSDWTSAAPTPRVDERGRHYPLGTVGNEMFVLTLAADSDGKWYVEDVHSPDLEQFNNLPLADPQPPKK